MNMEEINTGNQDLDDKIKEWLKWDQNETTKTEIESLLANENYEELSRILLARINFGTAGLRGKMAAGYTCMNDLVIVQTAQGLLKHLQANDLERLNTNGIIVGYDGRYNSRRFAELTTTIFVNQGVPVHLFSKVNPTPFVPFSVTKYGCAAGVMVTASHNPKEDNGYKVYGWNGAQIISPVDKSIQNHILENLEPWPTSWDTSIIENHPLVTDPLEETLESYIKCVDDQILLENKEYNQRKKMEFVYTAMHGVGFEYVDKVFKAVHLEIVPVEEQQYPDPEFPTVKFPNPEEGKSCLDLAMKKADELDIKVILANDPDADRLAVAEKDSELDEWKIFNGNELGALLGWWALNCYQRKNPGVSCKNVHMLASTVSSKILRSMAESEGFQFVETLTGFKWMGNKAYELIREEKPVVFAFEEAIGFMFGSAVLDKDGVSAAVHVATMANFLYATGSTLMDELNEIYKEYGYHISDNSYYICHDPVTIKNIFNRIRNYNGENKYPDSIDGGKYKIIGIRDLTTGYDNNQKDNKAILPVSKSSEMITFTFDNGLVATLRTSGTEPKIKYYTELRCVGSDRDYIEILIMLHEMVTSLVDEFLEPEKNNLESKQD